MKSHYIIILIIITILILSAYLIFNANGILGIYENDKISLLKLLGEYSVPFYCIYTKDDFEKYKWNIEYPIIFKPSICSARAKRVRIIKNEQEAIEYMDTYREPFIAQKYIPGREAVIFVEKNPLNNNISIHIEERIFPGKKKYWIWSNLNNENSKRKYMEIKDIKPVFIDKMKKVMDKLPGVTICRFDFRFTDYNKMLIGEDINFIEVNLTNAVDPRCKIKNIKKSCYYFVRFILLKLYYGMMKIVKRENVTIKDFYKITSAFYNIQICERV